jgi:hypothetical protein
LQEGLRLEGDLAVEIGTATGEILSPKAGGYDCFGALLAKRYRMREDERHDRNQDHADQAEAEAANSLHQPRKLVAHKIPRHAPRVLRRGHSSEFNKTDKER